MKHSNSKIALLVYAICPRIQAEKKAVFGSIHFQQSLALFEKLQDRTQRIAKESGLETFWVFDDAQVGKSFGERYSKAFADLFQQGFEQVISIGNDIPGLEVAHILEAKAQLQNSQTILGPAEDGGNYLIALSRSHFEEKSFSRLPWNSNKLHSAIKGLFQNQNGSVFQLEYLIDIDDFNSLTRFKAELKSGEFYRFIIQLLRSILTFFEKGEYFFNDRIISKDNPLRAPPALHF